MDPVLKAGNTAGTAKVVKAWPASRKRGGSTAAARRSGRRGTVAFAHRGRAAKGDRLSNAGVKVFSRLIFRCIASNHDGNHRNGRAGPFCAAAKGRRALLRSTPSSCASGPIGRSFVSCRSPAPKKRRRSMRLPRGSISSPLLALMADPDTLKVFHAARQDIEIFFNLSGAVPAPLFDTQIAAMVCGFGDAASYETLVGKLAQASLDKSSRFTDWSRRPLTERQIRYALADVVHLRTVYEKLQQRLASNGRASWFAEEMAELSNPETYRSEPSEAWRRFRLRGRVDPRFFGVLREVAAWREHGGAAAQFATRPDHAGRGGARDRRACAAHDRGAGADAQPRQRCCRGQARRRDPGSDPAWACPRARRSSRRRRREPSRRPVSGR